LAVAKYFLMISKRFDGIKYYKILIIKSYCDFKEPQTKLLMLSTETSLTNSASVYDENG